MKKIFLFLMIFIFKLSLIQSYQGSPLFPDRSYRYQLAVAAIFQEETPYIKEWIEFYRLMGVEHFYLFNHLNTDNFLSVLIPYMNQNLVTLIDWPYPFETLGEWRKIQVQAYQQAIEMTREAVKWLIVVDLDEFLFPVDEHSLLECLDQYYADCAGVCVNWQVFGTSFCPSLNANQLMTESLTWKAPVDFFMNSYVKSIVRPACVKHFNTAHEASFYSPYKGVNASHQLMNRSPRGVFIDRLRINHYWMRDEHYYRTVKYPRCLSRHISAEKMDDYYQIMNSTFDDSIHRFVPALRQTMGLLPIGIE